MLPLFPKEEEIMYAIWDIGHPCIISEILKHDPSQKRNTLAKVLVLLEKKKYLKVDSLVKTATRYGRAYAPIVSKEEYEHQKNLFSLVEKDTSVQKGVLSFVSTLVSSDSIDEAFIDEMKKIIDTYEMKRINTWS